MVMGKRAQFFILSAVIIAAIIVSMASVKNYVITGETPKRFHSSSQQLESEAGAVVDYVFFNSESSGDIVNFFESASDFLLSQNSGGGIFVCYYFLGSLSCANKGIDGLQVWGGSGFSESVSNAVVSEGKLKIKINDKEYSIDVVDAMVSKNQFYFVFRLDSVSGEYIDFSGDE